jgi:glycosidase
MSIQISRFAATFAALLALPLTAATHTFQLDTSGWDDQPRSVHVAGTFNNWNQGAEALEKVGPTRWVTEVELPDGVHHYKFVIDGQRWINDPAHSDAELEMSDGHGGVNSAVLVGLDPRKVGAVQPDHVLVEAVQFDPQRDVTVVSDEAVMVTVKVAADDATSVEAIVSEEPGESRVVELDKVGTQIGADRYAALLVSETGGLGFEVVVRDGDAEHEAGRFDFTELSVDVETPEWARHAVWYQIFPERFRNGDPSNDPGDAEYENLLSWTADWWDTHPEYGEVPGAENFYEGHGNVWKRRFGGDLQGVQQALPYLRELGVTALYFNPIFEADSMHKYDASDYRHIDDNFGVKSPNPRNQVPGETDDPATWRWSESDQVFLDFLQEAHRQGFRVVIDGVFNHTGRSHPFFQDVLAKGKDSRYADWYQITDWGDPQHWRKMDDPLSVHGQPGGIQWKAWDGPNGHLPSFKQHPTLGLAPGPRKHIFDITRRWMAPDGDVSRGIDGWRLDAPQEVPHAFWRDWRKLVKSINPEAYLVGEIWSPAHAWLQGDQFDAVMNYQFAMPAQDFFVDQQTALTPSAFGQKLKDVAYMYPLPIALVQQNLFDSHDTDRVASMFVNPDLSYDGSNRLQDTGPDYNPRKPNETEWKRLEQAVVCKMTYLGAPMIYYGTEAGMWSPDDPSDRMPMVWPDLMPYEDPQVEFRRPLFEHYQKLIALRAALPALRTGYYRTVLTDDRAGVVAYERQRDGQQVIVVLNRSPQARTIDVPVGSSGGGAWVDALAEGSVTLAAGDGPDARPIARLADAAATLEPRDGVVTVELPAYKSAVLVRPGDLP